MLSAFKWYFSSLVGEFDISSNLLDRDGMIYIWTYVFNDPELSTITWSRHLILLARLGRGETDTTEMSIFLLVSKFCARLHFIDM